MPEGGWSLFIAFTSTVLVLILTWVSINNYLAFHASHNLSL